MNRWRERANAVLRSPLTWILAVAALVRAVGITWGLPATDGWDNDGIAPRDFLPGLVESFTPGHYFTYPPVHLALLAVLTLPATVTGLVRAASLAPPDVVAELLRVPYMTFFAVVARGVSLAMALGIVWALAKMAEEVRGKRASYCVAAVCAVNVPLTYYAHTTNLDVPYLFWACLALLATTRAIARGEPKRLRAAAVFAALAVGTKDQAYALFALAPLPVVLWLAQSARSRPDVLRGARKELSIALAIFPALLLLVDGALVNPTGFSARVGFLTGAASQDFAQYSRDLSGRALAFVDSLGTFDQNYPLVFAPLAIAGIVMHVRTERGARLAAGLVPLAAGLSFMLVFNCVARRVEHRFVMPQMLMFGFYAGLALEPLLGQGAARTRPLRTMATRACAAAAFAWALYLCADVDAMMLLDPRYDAEAWLSAHARPSDPIEVHGPNVYLPRFPEGARVTRVDPDKRPAAGPFAEMQDDYGHVDARKPKWIVVSRGFAWRFLREDPLGAKTGRIVPTTQLAQRDADAVKFFRGLRHGELGYRLAHESRYESRVWKRNEIHASLGCEIWIFERIDGA